MIVRLLGTGTSTGVPEIGCTCEVCTSNNKKDKRLRTSALVRVGDIDILIDCGPDFREQALSLTFKKINGLLVTHEHYDHVGGIDDLRPYCKFGDVDLYAEERVKKALMERIPYCFSEHKYPGVPNIHINEISLDTFDIDGITIEPIRVMHSQLPIVGFRIDKFAYITDLKELPSSEYSKLKDLDLLVINALRIEEHMSHQNLAEALVTAQRINARETYFTHISHQLGLHEHIEKTLPQNIHLGYDGLEIKI